MATNTLVSGYDPIMYAQEALIQLENALGMARRVHMGYDAERRSFRRGSTVSIKRPSTFTAQDAPSSAQNLDPGEEQVDLNYWREVKFAPTDKDLAIGSEAIINDHIRPAAYALANDIDTKLSALYKDIPWYEDVESTPAISDLTNVRKVLFNNGVPLDDPSRVHCMIDGTLEAAYLANSAFSQWQGAGPSGEQTQMRGSLGTKFGMEIFANQNVQSHTPGVAADATGALTGDYAAGVTSIEVDEVTNAGTFKAGDTLVIAGNTQRYSITADATASGTGVVTLSIFPALVQAYSENDVVTIELDTHTANLAFHRNAFCLVTAPLSEMGNELGAKIVTVQDPITGLSLRHRMFYDGDSSAVVVALDVLYGVKTLDANLAARLRG